MSWSLVHRVEEEAAHCKAPATWAAAAPAKDNCPDVIYEPNAFDASTPPPVLAADQEASSSSCTRDAYGKCVPAGCSSYLDGCNTCNVGAVLGCTMMFCDTPQEPKCLEYKKD